VYDALGTRISHVLTVVLEFCKHAVAAGSVDSSVLRCLFEVGDDRKPAGGAET